MFSDVGVSLVSPSSVSLSCKTIAVSLYKIGLAFYSFSCSFRAQTEGTYSGMGVQVYGQQLWCCSWSHFITNTVKDEHFSTCFFFFLCLNWNPFIQSNNHSGVYLVIPNYKAALIFRCFCLGNMACHFDRCFVRMFLRSQKTAVTVQLVNCCWKKFYWCWDFQHVAIVCYSSLQK